MLYGHVHEYNVHLFLPMNQKQLVHVVSGIPFFLHELSKLYCYSLLIGNFAPLNILFKLKSTLTTIIIFFLMY